MHSLIRFFLCIGLTFAGGCASIVSDNESSTYIQTDPEHARCELHGQDFQRVVKTPESIHLPAKAAPITIACDAPEYKRTTANLDTEADGWIAGNLLFGGIIGVAIDAARGAGEKYPPQFTVILQPEQFDSTEARDKWFDTRERVLNERWSEAIERAESQCGPDGQAPESVNCEVEVKEAEERRQQALQKLELARSKAKIRGSTDSSDPGSELDPEVLLVILQRNGYDSKAEAVADYLTMDSNPEAADRFEGLPEIAREAIANEVN